MTAGPSRAIGYVRVSKAREEMISPELQTTAISDYCERSKCVLIDVTQDLDATGRNFARSGIQRVIERVEAGEANLVIVWKWSRFGRNVRDCLVNIDRLEAAGGRLVAATEDFDDTPVGRFGRGQFLLMAQFESERIGEQWKEAKARRVKMGLPGDGNPRFGYTYTREKGFEIDPLTAPVLLRMYEAYVAGQGFNQIADELNADGIATPRAQFWRSTSVLQMLDTGFGAGLLRVHAGKEIEFRPAAHEAVIDDDLWQAYLRARRNRARTPSRTLQAAHPLSGIVECGHCGSSMIRGGGSGMIRCSAYKKQISCDHPSFVGVERLRPPTIDFLSTVSKQINHRAKARQAASQRVLGASDEIKALTRQITRLESTLSRLTRQHAEGVVPTDAYIQTRDTVISEREQLEQRLISLTDSTQTAADINPDLLRDWDDLPVKTQRDILRSLLRRVVVTGNGRGNSPTITFEPRWQTSKEGD